MQSWTPRKTKRKMGHVIYSSCNIVYFNVWKIEKRKMCPPSGIYKLQSLLPVLHHIYGLLTFLVYAFFFLWPSETVVFSFVEFGAFGLMRPSVLPPVVSGCSPSCVVCLWSGPRGASTSDAGFRVVRRGAPAELRGRRAVECHQRKRVGCACYVRAPCFSARMQL